MYNMGGFDDQPMHHDWVHTMTDSSHCGNQANSTTAETMP